MSSVQSHFAQIPNQTRFLYCDNPQSSFSFTKANLTSILTSRKSDIIGFDGTILNVKNGNVHDDLIAVGTSLSSGDVYKDMGKKLYIQRYGQMHAIYSYCQVVGSNGSSSVGLLTEGVPNTPNVYICTWASTNENQMAVTRTG